MAFCPQVDVTSGTVAAGATLEINVAGEGGRGMMKCVVTPSQAPDSGSHEVSFNTIHVKNLTTSGAVTLQLLGDQGRMQDDYLIRKVIVKSAKNGTTFRVQGTV